MSGYSFNIEKYDFGCKLFSFDKNLYKWYEDLGNKAERALRILVECIDQNTIKGKGEFLWSCANKNIISNITNHGDILTAKMQLFEMKSANKDSVGNLMFAKPHYLACKAANKRAEYMEKLRDIEMSFLTSHSRVFYKHDLTNILKEIENIISSFDDEDLYYWTADRSNGYRYKLLNMYNNISNELANEYVRYIFHEHTLNNFYGKTIADDLDLMDKENFKLWHIINYCLYYIEYDAVGENLYGVLFSTNKNMLCITHEFLRNPNIEKMKNELKDFDIVYPKREINKNEDKMNDRMKNRAPGLIFRG